MKLENCNNISQYFCFK